MFEVVNSSDRSNVPFLVLKWITPSLLSELAPKVGVFSGSACCIWGRKPTLCFVSSSLFVGTVVLWYSMKNRCCFFPLDCIWTSSFWFFTNRFTDYFRSSTFGGEKTKRVLKSPNKHRLIRTVTVCLVSHTTACIHSCSYS